MRQKSFGRGFAEALEQLNGRREQMKILCLSQYFEFNQSLLSPYLFIFTFN